MYELGVGDDGKPHGLDENDLNESLSTLRRMAAAVGAEVTVLHCREGRSVGHVIEAIVRERPLDGGAGLIELRVAVVGNVDSGKSTLVVAASGGAFRAPPSRRAAERDDVAQTAYRRPRCRRAEGRNNVALMASQTLVDHVTARRRLNEEASSTTAAD